MKIRQNDIKLHIAILFLDLISVLLSLSIATFVRFKVFLGVYQTYDQSWLLGLILIIVAFINIAKSPIDKFAIRGPFKEFVDIISRQLMSLALLVIILYMAHGSQHLSRLVFIYYAVVSTIIIWLLRFFLKWYLINIHRKGKNSIKVFAITENKRFSQIQNQLNNNKSWDHVVCQLWVCEKNTYAEMLEYIVHNEVDEVFISLSEVRNNEDFQTFAIKIIEMGIRLDFDIESFEYGIPGYKWIDEVESFDVISIARNNISIKNRFIKRTVDIMGGLVGMIILAIVSIFLVPLIKLDSKGPAIFKQKRVGKNGRIFNFYKFRSMYADAEVQKKKLMEQNEVKGLMFKIKNDPRITKVGSFIRKTSLDELPQLWNVLKGDMSLVGTRPPTLDEYAQYESWQKARLSMRPGITGLWQVSGRSDIKDFSEVIKLDMKYIDNWSILSDIRILLKTIFVVLAKTGSR